MLHFKRFATAALLVITTSAGYSQTIATRPFHKVIVSPFIEATFIQGDQERVVINHSAVDPKKLHIEANDGTLRLYLDGAKEVPHDSRDSRGNDHQLYPDH